mmetsp:Transcript_46370/g.148067  ORF Transcript_46370/g.148067 Transcript_46370/m.148067 type:complete len:329 (-) Transcript_46370:1839-2825(-)
MSTLLRLISCFSCCMAWPMLESSAPRDCSCASCAAVSGRAPPEAAGASVAAPVSPCSTSTSTPLLRRSTFFSSSMILSSRLRMMRFTNMLISWPPASLRICRLSRMEPSSFDTFSARPACSEVLAFSCSSLLRAFSMPALASWREELMWRFELKTVVLSSLTSLWSFWCSFRISVMSPLTLVRSARSAQLPSTLRSCSPRWSRSCALYLPLLSRASIFVSTCLGSNFSKTAMRMVMSWNSSLSTFSRRSLSCCRFASLRSATSLSKRSSRTASCGMMAFSIRRPIFSMPSADRASPPSPSSLFGEPGASSSGRPWILGASEALGKGCL